MTDYDAEYLLIRTQVDALRDADNRTPIAVRFGAAQRDAIEGYVREITGKPDIGPILSFHGFTVSPSKRADHVALMYAEGDDPDPVETTPEIPPTPPEVPPSG